MRKTWIGAGAAAGLVLAGCNLGEPRVVIPEVEGDIVLAGDLDGDGVAEFVVGPTPDDGENGPGYYGLAVMGLTGGDPTDLVAGDLTDAALVDLDGDDDLDLVSTVLNRRPGTVTRVNAHLNDGTGAFPDVSGAPAGGGHSTRVAAGDLHGDGNADVVVIDQRVGLYVGDGAGGLAPGVDVPLPEGSSATAGAIADVDEDGDGDLVVVGGITSGQMVVLLSDGTGGFGTPVEYPLGNRYGRSVALGDVDGDGHLDAAVGTEGYVNAEAQVLLLRGDGSGAFDTSFEMVLPGSYAVYDVELGDIDEDGHLDVVYAAAGAGLNVLFSDGAGGLTDQHYLHPTGGGAVDAAIADMDGDGVVDVASAGGESQPGRITVFPNALGGARDHD